MTRHRTISQWGNNTILTWEGAGIGSTFTTSVLSGKVGESFDELHRGPPFRSGGPCDIRTAERTFSPATFHVGNHSPSYQRGQLVPRRNLSFTPSTPSGTWGFDPASSSEVAKATSLWSHARPGQSEANLGQFFGELERIPILPSRGLRDSLFRNNMSGKGYAIKLRNEAKWWKGLGNEYLNYAFGWVPFVNDLNDFIDATHSMSDHLAQLKRDNGKGVRRRITLPLKENPPWRNLSGTSANFALGWPTMHGLFYASGSSPWSDKRWTSQESAFVGKFRYWIPDIEAADTQNRLRRKLYGFDITPSLLWELTPWSWLIDWHTNVGDVMSNISGTAAENLVAEYAYYIHTFKQTWETQESIRLANNIVYQTSHTLVEKRYVRSTASPFGFGLKPADYSGAQVAILAALGLSRS